MIAGRQRINDVTAKKMLGLLRAKFSAPTFAFFENVADEASVGATRFADAVAMGLWRSRGILLHGFEIKVSRGDWLRELKKPDKAEPICQYCDRWWIAAADESIVRTDELPPTWGLLIPWSGGLKEAVKAPVLSPVPMTREFLGAVLRRAYEWRPEASVIADAEKDAEARGFEAGKKECGYEAARVQRDYTELKDRVEKFQEASGVNIDSWEDPRDVGKAVKAVLSNSVPDAKRSLRNLAERARNIAESIERDLEKPDLGPNKDEL